MVPVLDKNKNPLMPCSEKRARKLLESGDAKPYWNRCVFCIILQKEPKCDYKQDIAFGIDPGYKMSGYTVKSESHTLLNIQAKSDYDTTTRVSNRKAARIRRRGANNPYRKPKKNTTPRKKYFISPSLKARWDFHVNILNWCKKLFPISIIGIEEIKAATKKGCKKWNKAFDCLQRNKYYGHNALKEICDVKFYFGVNTASIRKNNGLSKSKKKTEKVFSAHCVDSWAIANDIVGGHTAPDNTRLVYIEKIMYHRRQLHLINPQKGNIRPPFGGTISLGIKKGSLAKHEIYGFVIIGGNTNNKLSLHRITDYKRINNSTSIDRVEVIANQKWKMQFIN